jgi:ribosomal protein L22
LTSSCSTPAAAKLGPLVQTRQKWSIFSGWRGGRGKVNNETQQQDMTASELDDPKKRQQFLSGATQSNAEGSIFQDEIDAPASAGGAETDATSGQKVQKTKENMAMVTDPDPRARVRWQRKKVIQMVRKNGHLTKEERIKMTERKLLHKSEFLPTSVKKLVMLARQIAGKPVDDAITQMQWSKKKMAAELKYYLEEARDLAIAQRGMGLGRVNGELFEKPRKIQTKEGKWMEINDPTQLYVAQSWVGRGPWRGKEIDYKGRGRMGVIQHPSTSTLTTLPSALLHWQ